MKLTLVHERATAFAIPGRLTCDVDEWSCFTLEVGHAIRRGKYEVVTAFSAALRKMLLAFRSDEGVIVGWIHSGSATDEHAPMHMLLGMDRAVDLIVDSRRAYDELATRVDDANSKFGEIVTIEIRPIDEPH